jgi:PTS system nitrogen regulatory IIA component
MDLGDILAERSVIAHAFAKTKPDLLRLMAQRAADGTGLDAGVIFESLSQREELGSTGLGNGIAIPHGKIAGLNAVTAVFARLEEPIDFDAVDDQPVDLVMMLLAPFGAGADHLRALSRVARLLRTDSIADQLRRADDPARMFAILTAPLATQSAA